MKQFFLLIFLFFATSVLAQTTLIRPKLSVATEGWYANEKGLPFWAFSNQWGKYHYSSSNSLAELHLNAADSIGKFFLKYDADAVGRRTSTNGKLWVQEIWFEANYKKLYFMAGRRCELSGIEDSLLSSGGALCSSNARPMPRISAGFNDYVDIPFTNKILSIKGRLEHGWFEENRYVHSPYLHHKNIYFRVNFDSHYHFYWGLEHYAQWGGTSSDNNIGKLPSSMSDFIRVFLGKNAKGSNPNLANETENSLGNHLGSFNYAFDIQFENWSALLYQQTFFEDGSGMNFMRQNREDGLWGISFKLKKQRYLSRIVYEFIHTTNQSGPTLALNAAEGRGGNDDYFNNGIYMSGWTYEGMSIGTPFISSPALLGNQYGTINNKIIAHYLGFMGNIFPQTEYKCIVSHSRNYGTNSAPYSSVKKQFSYLAEITQKLNIKPDIQIGIKIAGDNGELIENHLAFGFCLKANGLLSGY